jgi:hypothetical protein
VRALRYVSVPPGRPLETEAGRAGAGHRGRLGGPRLGVHRRRPRAEPVNGQGHQRPGLTHAMERLEGGEADCLIVTELARPVFEDDQRAPPS